MIDPDKKAMCEENAELRSELKQANEQLEKEKYISGLWHCAKCNFRLISKSLHVYSGSVTNNNKPEQCPNCYVPMWRVTYKDEYEQLIKDNDSLNEQLEQANKQLEIYKQAVCISKIDETEKELKEKTIAYERLLRACMNADELGELNELVSGWTLNEAIRIFNKYKPDKLKERKG